MKKKAFFFSIVSVLLIVLFGSITSLMSNVKVNENEIEITRTRIKVLNSLVKGMDDSYFENLLYVSVKNSLIGLSRYYSEGDDRIRKPLSSALTDVIDDGNLTWSIYAGKGSIDLTKPDWSGKPYMNETFTLKNMATKLKEKYLQLGMNITELEINIITGNITQPDPWHLQIEADIIYALEDISGNARWRGITTKIVNLSVYGLYAYDRPTAGSKQNKQQITEAWTEDKGPYYSEPSVLTKLNREDPTGADVFPGRGICSPDFDRAGKNCSNDVS